LIPLLLMTLGDQLVIPPAVVDGAKDELVIDVRDINRRVTQAENNRRAALLMAVDGEEFP
jgi:hypothetical protein